MSASRFAQAGHRTRRTEHVWGSTGLTGWHTPADVHGCHLGPDPGSRGLDDVALGGGAAGGRAVVDDDADAGSLGAGPELDLGALDQGGLGVGERTVEAG